MPTEDDTSTLARTIYGEARGEGETGMHAVANVIMNRFAKAIEGEITWWGHTIQGICKAKNQFSCWNSNDPNCKKISEVSAKDVTYAMALIIAGQAVHGILPDLTAAATSYYADTMSEPPYWAKGRAPCAHIGHHIFFRDPK